MKTPVNRASFSLSQEEYLVFLPLAYLLAVKAGGGVLGGYTAFVLWCVADCAALAVRFFRQKRWQRNMPAT